MATTPPGTFTVCDLPRDSFPPFLRYRLGRAMTPLLKNSSIRPEVAAVGFLRMTADWLNLVKLCDGDSTLVRTAGGRENLLRGTVAGARLAVGDVRVSRHSMMTLVQPNVAAVERAAERPLALQLDDALGDLALAQVVQSFEREGSFLKRVSWGAFGVGAVFILTIVLGASEIEGPVVLAAVTIAPSLAHLLFTVGMTLMVGAGLVAFHDSPQLVPALQHLRDNAGTVIVPRPS